MGVAVAKFSAILVASECPEQKADSTPGAAFEKGVNQSPQMPILSSPSKMQPDE